MTTRFVIAMRCRQTNFLTGWVDASPCRWTTDRKQRALFENEVDRVLVC